MEPLAEQRSTAQPLPVAAAGFEPGILIPEPWLSGQYLVDAW